MQITKKQFKFLLKECIKELLNEGSFNSALKEVVAESLAVNKNKSSAGVSAFDILNSLRSSSENEEKSEFKVPQYLNEIMDEPSKTIYEKNSLSQPTRNSMNPKNQHLSLLVKQTAAQAAGGDTKRAELMESIFADTALTSCVEQRNDVGAVSNLSQFLPTETPYSEQQLLTETKSIEALAPGGDISRWAKVTAMSLASKKN